MRFEKTLEQAIYGPWKASYIDYGKLKSILREDDTKANGKDDDDKPWTEEDENRFSDEIFNTQLEKVAQFQEEEVGQLRSRVDAAMDRLKDLIPTEDGPARSEMTTQRLQELEGELDGITNEVKELKKFSNINYTGFLKIVKKHDRKRGNRYRIGPIMRLSLAKRPFNSEQGYSPLLNKLSLLYFAIRQHLDGELPADDLPVHLDSQAETHNGEGYTAHKFWVHPDNLLEVKTIILRRLPALVYSEQSAGELDGTEDPTITSLYLDNPNFDLYMQKVDGPGDSVQDAASLRLRWYGQLSDKPDIWIEQKTVHGTGDSEERKIKIKEKYVQSFLNGEYRMEKQVQKMQRRGQGAEQMERFQSTADAIQGFVREFGLEPLLRAVYLRTAFQKPGDSRLRISIDTNITFIREDTLDQERPCRHPDDWHRTDMEGRNMTFPCKNINPSEVSRFPFAVLEIKLKGDSNRRRPKWIEDLMVSHLVHPAPRFSKFAHGVASLFEDHVNQLPFWHSDLERDIRKDPQVAFEEEELRKAQRAEDEIVVGSFLGNKVSSYKPSRSSPVAKSYLAKREAAENKADDDDDDDDAVRADDEPEVPMMGDGAGDDPEDQHQEEPRRDYGTLSSVFPTSSLSKYARARRARKEHTASLPPGVVEPVEWIKNSGPLQIEPKVWLANERTFLKWQHICILLGGLAVSLYTAAAKSGQNRLGEIMGIVFLAIAAFAGGWGYYIYRVRRAMIVQRSGKDFDNVIGPLVVSAALMAALVVNLVFAVSCPAPGAPPAPPSSLSHSLSPMLPSSC